MTAEDLATWGELCAWALARGHARSGDPAVIAGYLGTDDAFDHAMATFAEAYADQNERDHAALLAAIKSGRLVAKLGALSDLDVARDLDVPDDRRATDRDPPSSSSSADCENGPMDDGPGTTLRIDDLVLRPWRPDDAAAVFGVCQDPEIARWVTIPQPFEPSDADAFIENALKMWRDGTGAPFAIVDAVTDGLLGAVTRFGPEGHQATFGLWLAPDARGRGVGAAIAPPRVGLDVRDHRGHPPGHVHHGRQ